MFWIIAVPTVLAAIGVVCTRNVVHAALYLIGVLGGVAAQYLLLAAEFVAWVQVLIYIGAVVILFLFGIMLTRAPMRNSNNLDNDQRVPAFISGVLMLSVMGGLIMDAFKHVQIDIGDEKTGALIRNTGLTNTIGESVIHTYVVPFELVGMLLLAAVIGAVALARRD